MNTTIRNTAFILLATLAIATAWDGRRNGFLFGVNAGSVWASEGIPSNWNNDSLAKSAEIYRSWNGANFGFRVGYAWSRTSAALFSSNDLGSQHNLKSITWQIWSQNRNPAHYWFAGPAFWSYTPDSRAFHGMDGSPTSRTWGGVIGYGYEFAPHTSFDATFSMTKGQLTEYAQNGTNWEETSHRNVLVFGLLFSVSLMGY